MRKQKKSPAGACECPVEIALDLIDGKWKGVILYHLRNGALRFNTLRREMKSVGPRMLIRQLRELEQDGLIVRTVFAQVPPRVDYALSPEGESMGPIIQALYTWGSARIARNKTGAQRNASLLASPEV